MTTMAPPLPMRFTPHTKSSPHLFSVDEYYRMITAGILNEGSKVELIRGEVVDNMSQGDSHSLCLELLTRLLLGLIPLPVSVRCQSPIALGNSLPEPDFTVCTSAKQRGGKHPTAPDVYIVIELSDSSLDKDRTTKLELYAENGLAEYWIVNLPDDCVEVYTQPDAANLRYAMRVIYSRTQSVPVKFGGQDFGALLVDSLLP